jgi:hypothetical protein
MRRIVVTVACAALAACTPRLHSSTLAAHPPIRLTIERPAVVEASADRRPDWVSATRSDGRDELAIVGQGAAPKLDEATRAAERDLSDIVASAVGLEISSEFEADDSERSTNDGQDHRTDIHAEIRTNRERASADARAEATYWERIARPNAAGQGDAYRVFVLAHVSRAEIARARLLKLIGRAEKGRRTIAVLPFEAKKEDEALVRAFEHETARRLLESPAIAVVDPRITAALAPQNGDVGEIVERVLRPDAALSGSIARTDRGLSVRWRIRLRTAKHESVSDETILADDLFGLEERFLARILPELGGGR